MRKYRFHLLGLAHLPQSRLYSSCAFTQKNVKLASMLMSLGHEVIFYGSEGSDVECTKFIQTHTLDDLRRDYGVGDDRFEIGYDWTNRDFKHDFTSETKKPSTLKYYAKCIDYITKHKRANDFLLATQGYYQEPITKAANLYLTCEPGIGYRGSIKGRYRAFESSYIQNFTYGSENPGESMNGSYYDRVIPNYFDPQDIEYSNKKEDYCLFIGRMIYRKGIVTAYLAAKEAGVKLIIAGQGGIVLPDGSLTATDAPDFVIPPGNWEYIGYVNFEQRKHLMAKAMAVFTPTIYLECFAGTHVEAMLSGTPVITTNFGVYPGTVENGVNGYRCNTLNDFVEAVGLCKKLNPKIIRAKAEKYLMDNVKYEYQKWFDDLYQVYRSTTDEKIKGWHFIKRSK